MICYWLIFAPRWCHRLLLTVTVNVRTLLSSAGTLLPRLPSEPGMSLLTIKIEKIGLKDAGQCIDPYMTISVKGKWSHPVRHNIIYLCEVRVKVSSSVTAAGLRLQPHPFCLLRQFLGSLTVLLREVARMLRKMPVLVSIGQKQEHVLCFFVPADLNGIDLNPVQDTPVATRKEDTYIHFSVDVEIQRHVEKLPKGNKWQFIQGDLVEIQLCMLIRLNYDNIY